MSKRDEDITKALGLCWHKWKKAVMTDHALRWVCSKCAYIGSYAEANDYIPNSGHNFSTADGMLLILQKGPNHEWWIDFTDRLEDKHLALSGSLGLIHTTLLQDPDRLANELWEFLKGQE